MFRLITSPQSFSRFYEWKKDGSKKQPYYIHFKDGRPLVFAALYDSWENSEGFFFLTIIVNWVNMTIFKTNFLQS